jgi:hypothetical protein
MKSIQHSNSTAKYQGEHLLWVGSIFDTRLAPIDNQIFANALTDDEAGNANIVAATEQSLNICLKMYDLVVNSLSKLYNHRENLEKFLLSSSNSEESQFFKNEINDIDMKIDIFLSKQNDIENTLEALVKAKPWLANS